MDLDHEEDPTANADPSLSQANVRSIALVASDSVDPENEPPLKKARTKYTCNDCGTSYSKRKTLLRHERTPAHCEKAGLLIPSYPCALCENDFSRDDLRHRHEREVHLNISRSTGKVRQSRVAVTGTNGNERIAPSQPTSPICGPSGTAGTSTVSPGRNSTLSLVTQSTPQTDIDHELFVTLKGPESNNVEASYSANNGDTFAPPDHGLDHSARDTSPMSTIVEEKISCPAESEVEQDPPGLLSDIGSIRSMSTVGSVQSRFLASTNLLRSALIHKGATPRARSQKAPVLCVLCNDHLGSDVSEVRTHLNQHSELWNQAHSCQICQVSFTHERDLILHEKSVAKGNCGFGFVHIEKCSGHHPPDIFSEMLTDNDRLRFTLGLQHWEQAQLRVYLNQVNDLMHAHRISRDGDCWSIHAVRKSLVSLSSTQGYQKPRSALEPGEQLCRLDSSRLSSALANFNTRLKLRDLTSAAFKEKWAKARALVRLGGDVNAGYSFQSGRRNFPDVLVASPEVANEDVGMATVRMPFILILRSTRGRRHFGYFVLLNAVERIWLDHLRRPAHR